MARLLVVLTIAGVGVVGWSSPAHACRCIRASVAGQAERADVVFTGRLVEVTRVPAEGGSDRVAPRQLSFRVAADLVYKGVLTASEVDVATDALTASCGLGRQPVDRDYVFFVRASGASLTTDLCSGTRQVNDSLLTRLETALGPGTSQAPEEEPPPDEAQQTVLELAEPAEFLRLAAPGAALALVGMLGLLVVGRVGRR